MLDHFVCAAAAFAGSGAAGNFSAPPFREKRGKRSETVFYLLRRNLGNTVSG